MSNEILIDLTFDARSVRFYLTPSREGAKRKSVSS